MHLVYISTIFLLLETIRIWVEATPSYFLKIYAGNEFYISLRVCLSANTSPLNKFFRVKTMRLCFGICRKSLHDLNWFPTRIATSLTICLVWLCFMAYKLSLYIYVYCCIVARTTWLPLRGSILFLITILVVRCNLVLAIGFPDDMQQVSFIWLHGTRNRKLSLTWSIWRGGFLPFLRA